MILTSCQTDSDQLNSVHNHVSSSMQRAHVHQMCAGGGGGYNGVLRRLHAPVRTRVCAVHPHTELWMASMAHQKGIQDSVWGLGTCPPQLQ